MELSNKNTKNEESNANNRQIELGTSRDKRKCIEASMNMSSIN